MANAIPCKHCGRYQTDHEIDFSVSDQEAKTILEGFTHPLLGENRICQYTPLYFQEEPVMLPTPSFPGYH